MIVFLARKIYDYMPDLLKVPKRQKEKRSDGFSRNNMATNERKTNDFVGYNLIIATFRDFIIFFNINDVVSYFFTSFKQSLKTDFFWLCFGP